MKLNFFRRLDVRLSAVMAITLILSFISILFSAWWISIERNKKLVDLEKQRISVFIETIKGNLLSDILLAHTDGIQLTLKDLNRTLQLDHSELILSDGKKFKEGQVENNSNEKKFAESFLITHGETTYATLSVQKLVNHDTYPILPVKYWIIAILLILCGLFFVLNRFVQNQIIIPLRAILDRLTPGNNDPLNFEFNAGSVEMYNLIDRFKTLIRDNIDYRNKIIENEKSIALGNFASQVAHDIRSPLSALNTLSHITPEIPEKKRELMKHAIQRIQHIANDLIKKSVVNKNNDVDENLTDEIVRLHIDALIAEKKLQLRDTIKIETVYDSALTGLFAKIQPQQFNRILSNVVDNAIDAIDSTGKITVRLFDVSEMITITVQDNGKGIPENILSQLMNKGASFGKKNGLGLGLYHAKTTIEKWNGNITIQSDGVTGTKVSLSLPKQKHPAWFVPTLVFKSRSKIVIVDDDSSIHHIWTNRFAELNCNEKEIELHHFDHPEKLKEWLIGNDIAKENITFLFDYEFSTCEKNGIDAIVDLNLQKHAVLVTSHYSSKEIQDNCIQNGITMLPKEFSGIIPIIIL